MQNNMTITDKLRDYLFNLYKENTMNLKDLRFECKACQVHFTPSETRAKALMIKEGAINVCKECEEE